IGAQRTQLTITGMGFGPGPLYDKAWSFFQQGNQWTLAKMQKALGHDEVKQHADRAWTHLKSRVGGDWIAEQTRDNGTIFRARTHWETSLDGQLIIVHGWLGDASGMREHAVMLASLDPQSGGVRFDQFLEGNHAAHGEMIAL